MSICRGITWECESCHRWDTSKPWPCPVCGKETCECCFSAYGLCKDCGEGKSAEECKALSIAGGWDWSED